MTEEIIGWDIGGAHLKLARALEGGILAVRQLPCALWQGLERLEAAFEEGLAGWPAAKAHAVTMTGELADLFPDRASGVRAILDALARRVGERAISVYASDGSFLSLAAATDMPARVASANWHATARLLACRIPSALLVDIGSTTTDLVPLRDGRIAAIGYDDAQRLASDELVYRGVVRTPIMAVVRHVEFEGARLGVMAEHFATMGDVYRLTGELPAHADRHATADGRGKSLPESRSRLARMIGRDAASAPDGGWDALARQIAMRQLGEIEAAARRVITESALPATAPLIGAGVGRFLAASLAKRLGRRYLGFETMVEAADVATGESAADCAPAAAVALLLAAASSSARTPATAARESGALRPPEVKAERKPR
jgi:probable H4MPT-linked C1 transfer pathway protein